MTKKYEKFFARLSTLSTCELIAYAAFIKCKKEHIKPTIDNIHFEVVNYVLKFHPKIEGESDIVKILKKIAIPSKTQGEWKLKNEFVLESQ